MAQAGIHALLGAAVGKVTRNKEWLVLGIVLGSIFPDMDNFAVAVATLAKLDTHGLHRTATHSVLAILAAVAVFYIIGQVRKQPRWTNLGLGFGLGIGLHIALDLLLWFNGVELLWPFGGWVNFWEGVQAPEWFSKLMDPLEYLFFFLWFAWLLKAAQDHKTDARFLKTLRVWLVIMAVLFVVLTPLAFIMTKGFFTINGAAYLISIMAAFIIAIRMRATIEAATA